MNHTHSVRRNLRTTMVLRIHGNRHRAYSSLDTIIRWFSYRTDGKWRRKPETTENTDLCVYTTSERRLISGSSRCLYEFDVKEHESLLAMCKYALYHELHGQDRSGMGAYGGAARRRMEYRRKVDPATRCTGVRPHT